MPDSVEAAEPEPLIQPRLIQAVKNRPRLIDMGVRRDMLEHLEMTMRQKRTAEAVASRASGAVVNTARGSAEPVVRDKLNKNLNRVNDSILNEV